MPQELHLRQILMRRAFGAMSRKITAGGKYVFLWARDASGILLGFEVLCFNTCLVLGSYYSYLYLKSTYFSQGLFQSRVCRAPKGLISKLVTVPGHFGRCVLLGRGNHRMLPPQLQLDPCHLGIVPGTRSQKRRRKLVWGCIFVDFSWSEAEFLINGILGLQAFGVTLGFQDATWNNPPGKPRSAWLIGFLRPCKQTATRPEASYTFRV